MIFKMNDVAIDSENEDVCAAATSFELTDKERYYNAAWRMRLVIGPVFSRDYTPKRWERKEMDGIIESLALENPNDHPKFLNEPGHQVTKKAISSIFFAEPNELQSVLLKRGSVLLGGEERELMLFTNGFVFSPVELDTLVNHLLDVNSGGADDLNLEQLCARFSAIDVDHSGSLDRCEIREFFRGTGMALSETALDGLLNKFDSDSDGTISLNEFKSIVHEMHHKPETQSNGNLWRSLGTKLRRALGRTSVTRRLDVAFQMADIRKIENISIIHGNKTKTFSDSEWAQLTLAVYIKGVIEPLLVTCAKPGHVEAWMEAFNTCITSLKSRSLGVASNTLPEESIDHSHAGLICGVRDSQNEEKQTNRTSLGKWLGSTVDWADEDTEE